MTTAEIEAMLAAATPGPWFFNSYSTVMSGDRDVQERAEAAEEDYDWLEGLIANVPAHHGDTAIGNHAADAELIAAAPTALRELLDANRELTAALTECGSALEGQG